MKQHAIQHQARHFSEIKHAMTCILMVKNLNKFPQYLFYFEDERWKDLIKLFQQENFKVTSMTTHPLLNVYLTTGISTLKTKACRHSTVSYTHLTLPTIYSV
eukprot:TRINITY_DN5891_c0_g1_i12.p2 TRINITY_DN5891_c0_g1~~TRINITY_DN5891_c0_g1_i12.p2  ORF type:complete len:102 (-),score=19.59 TRINITY_DN5891_c0_g1_i12:34-339(-)